MDQNDRKSFVRCFVGSLIHQQTTNALNFFTIVKLTHKEFSVFDFNDFSKVIAK